LPPSLTPGKFLSAIQACRKDTKLLNPRLIDEIVTVVNKYFPENQYVALARNTKGIYDRRQAPPHKYHDRSFELELAARLADSANLSRRAIASIRVALDEVLLQRKAKEPTLTKRVIRLALAIAKWIFANIAAVIVAILVHILGIKG
jgi:hypothetical protein